MGPRRVRMLMRDRGSKTPRTAATDVESHQTERATGMDMHCTMWSNWRSLMSDNMLVVWMKAMQRTGNSVATAFNRTRSNIDHRYTALDTVQIIQSGKGDAPRHSPEDALGPACDDSDILDESPKSAMLHQRKPTGLVSGVGPNATAGNSRTRRRPALAELERLLATLPTSTRLKLARGITVDSGAADNVIPRRVLRKWMKIRGSEASRLGVHYVAANGAIIPNEGEVDFSFQDKQGKVHTWVFQVADVNKILASVSSLVDSGHRVVFDKCPDTGVDLSFITHKTTGESVRMRRERNVWTIDAFVNEDPDFTRRE